jgi:hypothetical protein
MRRNINHKRPNEGRSILTPRTCSKSAYGKVIAHLSSSNEMGMKWLDYELPSGRRILYSSVPHVRRTKRAWLGRKVLSRERFGGTIFNSRNGEREITNLRRGSQRCLGGPVGVPGELCRH